MAMNPEKTAQEREKEELEAQERVKEFHRRIGHKGAVTLHEKIKRGEVHLPEKE